MPPGQEMPPPGREEAVSLYPGESAVAQAVGYRQARRFTTGGSPAMPNGPAGVDFAKTVTASAPGR